MRRVGVVLVVALAVTGCGVRTETVPGPAAPLTATGSPAATTPPPGTGATPSGTTPSGTSPAGFRNVSMTGFGLTIAFPVPVAWTVVQPRATPDLARTDAKVGDAVLLRVDLTARSTGTARSWVEGNEADNRRLRPAYDRRDVVDIRGVGDDAVDWTFTYNQGDTPVQVIDRKILSGPGEVAVYLRAPAASYARYLPAWQQAVGALVIRTS